MLKTNSITTVGNRNKYGANREPQRVRLGGVSNGLASAGDMVSGALIGLKPFHHSTTPPLHYSNNPLLHSITPRLHHSVPVFDGNSFENEDDDEDEYDCDAHLLTSWFSRSSSAVPIFRRSTTAFCADTLPVAQRISSSSTSSWVKLTTGRARSSETQVGVAARSDNIGCRYSVYFP